MHGSSYQLRSMASGFKMQALAGMRRLQFCDGFRIGRGGQPSFSGPYRLRDALVETSGAEQQTWHASVQRTLLTHFPASARRLLSTLTWALEEISAITVAPFMAESAAGHLAAWRLPPCEMPAHHIFLKTSLPLITSCLFADMSFRRPMPNP